MRLFALLHDTGHPPFSHATERVLPGEDHELISLYVVEGLEQDLNRWFFDGAGELTRRMLKKSPDLAFLTEFVASEMDMD